MKLTTYAQTLHDLGLIKEQGITEVILAHKDFARFGKLSSEEFNLMVKRAHELGLRVLFEWDILMVESTFSDLVVALPKLIENVSALRVQDPGALEWSLENTKLPVQFIAENGNHNFLGLQSWIEHASGRMERIILSIELNRDVIKEYVQKLTVPCELLGLGRILLFYTPRSLLRPLTDKVSVNGEISALGESEESPHRGFPIVENKHGTFMFHIKEFCLVEFAQELNKIGLHFFRVDLRWENFSYLSELAPLIEQFSETPFQDFKERYSQDLMRGFYLVNKTDVLFPKLKNSRLQKREGSFVGEVMEAEKGSHLAILIKNTKGLKRTDRLRILHPKGETFDIHIHSLKNLLNHEVDSVASQKLALIPYVNGVWVKSQVFFIE